MKVLFIHHASLAGGAERSLFELACAVRDGAACCCTTGLPAGPGAHGVPGASGRPPLATPSPRTPPPGTVLIPLGEVGNTRANPRGAWPERAPRVVPPPPPGE